MIVKNISNAVILWALSLSTAQADTFFGIEIGGPFNMRECIGADFDPFKDTAANGLCTSKESDANHPWGAVTHLIEHPVKMKLVNWGPKPYGFAVSEFQGAVVHISFATYGADWQDAALKDLGTKFGKPSSLKQTPVQNLYGVKRMKISALWKKHGYTVAFVGIDGSIDIGRVTINTDGAELEKSARDQWRAQNQPQQKM